MLFFGGLRPSITHVDFAVQTELTSAALNQSVGPSKPLEAERPFLRIHVFCFSGGPIAREVAPKIEGGPNNQCGIFIACAQQLLHVT